MSDELRAKLKKGKSKYSEPKSYYCDIMKDEFYFAHDTLRLSEIATNEKIYPSNERQMAARYAVYACDENGQRYYVTTKDIKKFIDEHFQEPEFYEHALAALVQVGLWKASDSTGQDANDANEKVTQEKKDSQKTT